VGIPGITADVDVSISRLKVSMSRTKPWRMRGFSYSPLFGCCALFGRLGASRVVAGAVGSPEVLKRRGINGDQASVQEHGYAIT
jgi:hypothetical protein